MERFMAAKFTRLTQKTAILRQQKLHYLLLSVLVVIYENLDTLLYTHTLSLRFLGYKDMGQSGLSITAPYIGTRRCMMASQMHRPLQHTPASTWLYNSSGS
jgi:hypothetical protein